MKSGSPILRRVLLAVALPTLAALAGTQLACATTKTHDAMRSGVGVPASEGKVTTSSAANGNTNVNVHIKHLAPARKLVPDATVYIVWIQPRTDPSTWENVGALVLNDNLEGSLDTVTAQTRFRVEVTPEVSGTVPQPTHDSVLSADVGPE